jgi:DtxR family Mn-dependent transcriptional regulator
MVGRLAERGLLTHKPYKRIALTAKGRDQALTLIRRHRLWERFLTDVLGLPWDQVHEEACRLEHETSTLVEDGLAQFLGGPDTCPHGHPVPTAEGEIGLEGGYSLAQLKKGQRARVLSVPEDDDGVLRYLAALGLEPDATILVEEVAPFQDPLTLRVGQVRHALGRELASKILVRPV